jgi:dTDP-4-amino-4,6-dideoxygalactose transaminase
MIPISKPYIGETEKAAVLEVLESGMLAQGPRVAKFEERFAQVCGVKHAIATANGTTALHIALLAHGIGPGDEVITTPFTFIASANSILFTGARPVFVDVEAETFNLDPARIEKAITARTKALMPPLRIRV